MRYLLLLTVCCLPCCKGAFPTAADVDATVSFCTRQDATRDQKVERLEGLFDRLRQTETVANDAVIGYAADQLAQAYLQYHEVAIPEAVDATHKDGGFATYLEGFYRDVSKDEAFRERCRQSPAAWKAFQRGSMLSDEEIRQMLNREKPAR